MSVNLRIRLASLLVLLVSMGAAVSAQAASLENENYFSKTVTYENKFWGLGWTRSFDQVPLATVQPLEGSVTIKLSNDWKRTPFRGWVAVNGSWIWVSHNRLRKQGEIEVPVTLQADNTARVIIWGRYSTKNLFDIQINGPALAQEPTAEISVLASEIALGDSTILTWQTENADSVSIEPEVGVVDASGSIAVSPVVTTTYTITSENALSSVSESVTLSVLAPPPTLNSVLKTNEIYKGEKVLLSWQAENADSVEIESVADGLPAQGAILLTPEQSTTYRIIATGSGGQVENTHDVVVSIVELEILQPQAQAVVSEDTVNVSGRIVAPASASILVNGVLAQRDGSDFTAEAVALLFGENTLVITAYLSGEEILRTELVVSSMANKKLFNIHVHDAYGVAPHHISLKPVVDSSLDKPVGFRLDWDGDGIYELDRDSMAVSLEDFKHVYTSAGRYTATMEIDLANGQVLSDSVNILVVTQDQQTSAASLAFNNYKDALTAKDVDEAIKHVAFQNKELVKNTLDVLYDHLPEMVASYSEVSISHVSGQFVEFVVVRDVEGQQKAYFITMVRSSNGQWRIYDL